MTPNEPPAFRNLHKRGDRPDVDAEPMELTNEEYALMAYQTWLLQRPVMLPESHDSR